jgi:hypothetical protein
LHFPSSRPFPPVPLVRTRESISTEKCAMRLAGSLREVSPSALVAQRVRFPFSLFFLAISRKIDDRLTMFTFLSFDVKAVSETSDSCRLICNTHPCVSRHPILTSLIDLKQNSFVLAAPAPTTPPPPLKNSPTSVPAGASPPPTFAPFTTIPLRSSRWTRRRRTLVGLR